MNRETLQKNILKLLKTSTIPEERKNDLRTFLVLMSLTNLNKVFRALKREKNKMMKLDQKEERIKLKYKVMVEKLSEMKLKK